MTVVLFTALVWKTVDFLRELANFKMQRSAIVTQATAWLGGIGLVAIGAHAAMTQNLVLPGTTLALGKLDAGSIILAGLAIASTASSVVDLKQAVDHSDSATKPPLLAPPGPPDPNVAAMQAQLNTLQARVDALPPAA